MAILSLNILEQTKLWTLHQKLLTRLLFNLIKPMAIVFVLEPKETASREIYFSTLYIVQYKIVLCVIFYTQSQAWELLWYCLKAK